MTMVYPTDTDSCAACGHRVRSSNFVGLYLVGPHAAIGYALCKTCGKLAAKGLPPDLLRQLDAKLEAEAARFGLTQTH